MRLRVESNIDQIAAELDQLGEDIQNVTEVTLQDLANQLPQQVRQQIFSEKENRTGTLRRSISAQVRGTSLVFGMQYYGYFQTFGVTGARRGSLGIPSPYAEATGKTPGGKYKFDKINHPGILPVQSAARTLESVAELIVEALTEE